MPDEKKTVLKINLGKHGPILKFETPDELLQWNQKERQQWEWMYDNVQGRRNHVEELWREHDNFFQAINHRANEWKQNRDRNAPDGRHVDGSLESIKQTFNQFYAEQKILNSKSADAEFIFKLKEADGIEAIGAYLFISGYPIRFGGNFPISLWKGVAEGFLYRRGIDWKAQAHGEALDKLKVEYQNEKAKQQERANEIEERNKILNEEFATALNRKKSDLDALHAGQIEAFAQMIEKSREELKGIEDTYNEKLALQKPVEFWGSRKKYHEGRSADFATYVYWAGGVAALMLILTVIAIFWNLKPNEDPKTWQFGILFVIAFFSIWGVRILVRQYFSHLHLATDADERLTMILTYVSMAREGSEVKPEDKQLILQHIFRSASDGLVKDDAAPPTFLEMLTRGK